MTCILARIFTYLLSFFPPDSGLYLSNGFDFYFDLIWMAIQFCLPLLWFLCRSHRGTEAQNFSFSIFSCDGNLSARDAPWISSSVSFITDLIFIFFSRGDSFVRFRLFCPRLRLSPSSHFPVFLYNVSFYVPTTLNWIRLLTHLPCWLSSVKTAMLLK